MLGQKDRGSAGSPSPGGRTDFCFSAPFPTISATQPDLGYYDYAILAIDYVKQDYGFQGCARSEHSEIPKIRDHTIAGLQDSAIVLYGSTDGLCLSSGVDTMERARCPARSACHQDWGGHISV